MQGNNTMKLRVYLRGLGIGIFVTALILAIGTKHRTTMTDEQIIEKAKALGMVENNQVLLQETANNATELMKEEAEQEIPEQEAEQETPEQEIPKEEESKEKEPIEEPALKEISKEDSPEEPTQKEEASGEEEVSLQEPVQEKTPASEKQEEFVLEISSGSGSDRVSRLLEKGGVVENAGAFDEYLCKNNYDNRIVAGRHVIPAGADFHTIATIITSKQSN